MDIGKTILKNKIRIIRAAILIFLILTTAAMVYFLHAPCDDTYIYLVYVKNLLSGNGLTFNGMKVQGYTSPMWMALLAVTGLIFKNHLPLGAQFLSFIFGMSIPLIFFHITWNLSHSLWKCIFVWMILLSIFGLMFYTGSGLETALFSALVLVFFLTIDLDNQFPGKHPCLFGTLIALIFLTRPEGIIFLSWEYCSPW